MTLNTYVAGNPGDARSLAQELRKLGQRTEATATAAHQSRTQAAGEWNGPASEAFQGWARTQGTDGDALAEVYPTVAHAHDAWANEIDTVKARMEQARQVARDGGLTVMGAHLILPPKTPGMAKPEPPQGRATASQSEEHSKDVAAYETAMAEHRRQQEAWEEAKATVTDAREKERAAHEQFTTALDKAKVQLTNIGQAQKWAQAGTKPASTAAASLASTATAMESSSAAATRSMLERSIGNPAAVNAAWSVMTSAQRSDLIASAPQMVGSTDGVPCVARDQANRSILGEQRANLVTKIKEKTDLIKQIEASGGDGTWLRQERQQLHESLDSLDGLSNQLDDDKYLLGIDSTANQRGQIIVAEGNPDHADNTTTLVPGTYSDLSGVQDFIGKNEQILERANELTPEGTKNVAVAWIDYEAPSSLLPGAAMGEYAQDAHPDLSNFQEGIRATHEGDTPSHNTLIGHSYGSTVVGEASDHGGSYSDNIAFVGSPGVGVDHADQLDTPNENVWASRSDADIIDYTPSLKPWEWVPGFGDYARYGLDPTDPEFGAEHLASQPETAHGDYWKDPVARDGMARIMTGTTQNGDSH